MKYRIYIDEVGNPDLESSDNPNHRFLSLTGVIIELSHVDAVIHPQMEALKKRFFGSHPDDPVVFHRKEMLSAKPPFEALADPGVRERFDNELLALLQAWQYTVVSVCLDKKRHKETYATWRYDPYHYCLAVLLERFVLFLKRRGGRGDVMAESRGGKEDVRLKASFERLHEHGTEYVKPEEFAEVLTSRQLKVKLKANNVTGLQVADLIAHPSRNEILIEHGLQAGPLARFAQRVAAVLGTKYDRVADRSVGKKML
ncbi:MAG: DUF3800 domain-containing protein [Armatimonadota bacterium]